MPFKESGERRSVQTSLCWLWQDGSYTPKSLAHEVQSVDTHVSQPLQVLCHELDGPWPFKMQQLTHLSATPSFIEIPTGVNTGDRHPGAYLFAILMVVDAFPLVASLDFLAKQLCSKP